MSKTIIVTLFYPKTFKTEITPNPSLQMHAEESMHSSTRLPKIILHEITFLFLPYHLLGVGGT